MPDALSRPATIFSQRDPVLTMHQDRFANELGTASSIHSAMGVEGTSMFSPLCLPPVRRRDVIEPQPSSPRKRMSRTLRNATRSVVTTTKSKCPFLGQRPVLPGRDYWRMGSSVSNHPLMFVQENLSLLDYCGGDLPFPRSGFAEAFDLMPWHR